MKTVLSIAGSDASGGAGIQADIKTMTMQGVYAMSVITALTAQNTTGVRSILESTPEFLADQLDAVFEDIAPDAVKIGMVPTAEQMKVIARRLAGYKAQNIVVDPVMVSTSGSKLMKGEAVYALTRELLPLADLVTPNLLEAQILTGEAITDRETMERAAEQIGRKYGCAVLLKGGHFAGGADDVLYMEGSCRWFLQERIENPNTHGTGCTLSSAIASNLAKGFSLPEAVEGAKRYLTGVLQAGLDLGRGSGPLQHNYELDSFFREEGKK